MLCRSLALVALLSPVGAARANPPAGHGHEAAAHAHADAHGPAHVAAPAAPPPTTDDTVDDGPMLTVLVLDTSRLMQVRDPERLAPAAAHLLAGLLRPRDRLALVGFAEEAAVLLPPTAHEDGLEAALTTALSAAAYTGQATRVGEGLRAAARVFLEGGRAGELRRVLVLTGGGEDPVEGRRAAWAEEQLRTRELVPDQLRSLGATIHTIAFTRAADAALLAAIAGRSGGTFHRAVSPDGLAPAMIEALADRGARVLLPVDADGRSFAVDDAVEELRVVFDRALGAPALLAPDGQSESAEAPGHDATWGGTRTHGWARLVRPTAGTWQLEQAAGAPPPVVFVRDRAPSPRLRIAERVATVDHRPRLIVSTPGEGPREATGIVIVTDPDGRRSQLSLERSGTFGLQLELPLARPGRHHLDVQVQLDGRARALSGELDVGPSCLDARAEPSGGRLVLAARTSTACASARVVSAEAIEQATGERFALSEEPHSPWRSVTLLSPSGPDRLVTLEAALEVGGESLRVTRGPFTLEPLSRKPAPPWYLGLLQRLGMLNAPLLLVGVAWVMRARRAAKRSHT